MEIIKRDMTLGEVVSRFPETAGILMKYGMQCVGCHVAANETIEEGARVHGMDDEQIDKMIKEMNSVVQSEKGTQTPQEKEIHSQE